MFWTRCPSVRAGRLETTINRLLPWLALLAMLAFNGWGLFSFLFPLVNRWLEGEHARNLTLLLDVLGIVLPPLWLSRKMKRKRVWFRRYFAVFQVLLTGGLVYWATGRPPALPTVVATPTPTPAVTPSRPRPLLTPLPKATSTPSITVTPEVEATPDVTPEVTETPAAVPQFVDGSEADKKYAAIDQHALKAPAEVEKDVQSLARYLAGPARNDEEKIRAIYRWVTDRITYDAEAFYSRNLPDPSSGVTLSRRTAVCGGYAVLVDELGKAAGLKTEYVRGFASGSGADPGRENNHAWNAVKLPGGWRLIDATWGAGSLGQDHKFHKGFDSYFFLTPADQMLVTHFPAEKNWQLILPPITRAEFLSRPKRTPEYYRLGLKVDQLVGELEADPRATVQFQAPKGLYLGAELQTEDGREVEHSAMVDRDDGRIVVNFMPPAAGKYRALIFAFRPGQDHGNEVLEYTVVAKSGRADGYPEISRDFQAQSGHVFSPSTGVLKAGRQHFEMELPGARQVFVNDWAQELRKDGDRFVGEFDLPAGKTQVFAVFSGETGTGVVRYDVR